MDKKIVNSRVFFNKLIDQRVKNEGLSNEGLKKLLGIELSKEESKELFEKITNLLLIDMFEE